MADLRFALRQFLKSPAFALVAILTLAVGIGVNTAIYSLAGGLLLRPLDLPEIDRMVMIFSTRPDYRSGSFAAADFFDRDHKTSWASAISIRRFPRISLMPLPSSIIDSDGCHRVFMVS